jgi:hypothetical protein
MAPFSRNRTVLVSVLNIIKIRVFHNYMMRGSTHYSYREVVEFRCMGIKIEANTNHYGVTSQSHRLLQEKVAMCTVA